MTYRFLRLAPLLPLMLLGGCSTWDSLTSYISSDNPYVCPDASILAPTAVLPAFDPSEGIDPSTLRYRVAFTNITTRCDYSKADRVADTRLHLFFHATRPPGGAAADYRVPYYIAISSQGNILEKNIHWLDVTFDSGAVSADGDFSIDDIPIAVGRDRQAYDYHVLAGFQLTKEQLDYNNKIGRYEP